MLEDSRAYTLGIGVPLKPRVEVALRHDGGDAETGTGMDIGGGLVVSDALTGLSVDVRMRMLLVHEAEGFRERSMAVSFNYNPTSPPLGFKARVAPSWGGQARWRCGGTVGWETMATWHTGRSLWQPPRCGGLATGCRWGATSWRPRAARVGEFLVRTALPAGLRPLTCSPKTKPVRV